MDGPTIQYATAKDWLDIMKNRSKVRMHELIERLGLRAKWSSNKRGKTNFESSLVRELVTDMGELVSKMPKEADELIRFLSDDHSMKRDVDELLVKHGARVWGRAGDREHLITANEPGVEEGMYPRDLYLESDEDRELIKKLLHWWIGLKACNVILARERLDRERRKKAETRQARVEAEISGQHAGEPALFVALAPNSVLPVDTGSRGSSMSSNMRTPTDSPITGPREGQGFAAINGGGHLQGGPVGAPPVYSHQVQPAQQPQNLADGVWQVFQGERQEGGSEPPPAAPRNQAGDNKPAVQYPVANPNTAALDRQISVEVAKLVAGFRADGEPPEEVPQPNDSVPYRGLNYDSIRALRAYVYKEENGIKYDEDTLLDGLERRWREGVRGDYDKVREDVAVFIARERAFLTWIELKRHMAALERANERWRSEGDTPFEIKRRIQQHKTLMGATATILASFEDIGKGFGLGPEIIVDRDELLRQAIVVLAGGKFAVEMQWQNIEYAALVRWLQEILEAFRPDEEEENRGMLWYHVG